MLLLRFLAVVLPLLTAASSYHLCNCKYHAGGCAIQVAAPMGFKCKCIYRGAWTCSGFAYPCRPDEACPGGRYSYCACMQGGGNCGAYKLRAFTKQRCNEVNKVEASSSLKRFYFQDCNCKYSKGGCLIDRPAVEGFKCVCVYKGFWTCTGWPQGCDEDEYCPAGHYSYCGCRKGRGNCGGYPSRDKSDSCNFGRPAPRTCSCQRSSDWTYGQYSVDDVIFEVKDIVKNNPQPAQIGTTLDVPNASTSAQILALTVVETLTTESSFERTSGITVANGLQFVASLPAGPLTGATTLTTQQSFTFGKKNTTSTEFRHQFTCTSQPKTLTKCMVFITSYDVIVPYTMLLRHEEIQNCVCRSSGNWKGTLAYKIKMNARSVARCNQINYEGDCTP